eukprot:scaffold19_cov336-Pinguiococcus_pyrenoidosus.AAC.7
MASHEKTPFSDRSRPMLLPLSSIIRLYEAISERSSGTFPGVERMRSANALCRGADHSITKQRGTNQSEAAPMLTASGSQLQASM